MNTIRSIPRHILLTLVLTAIPSVTARADEPASGNWPSFRGHHADGVAEGHTLPTTWDVPAGQNVKWKTPIPGLGHSCPVIWGNRIFVTTAVSGLDDPELKVGLYGNIASVQDDTVHQWRVLCLDKNTGKILWERTAHQGVPAIKRHTKSTHANSTPATDGQHLVAFFGSEGLYCYNLDGDLLWSKQLGVLDSGYYTVPDAQWGFASSPVIHDGKVFIQCDVQGDSFLAALNLRDGKEIWRTPRDEVPTWSTPTIHTAGGRSQIIVNGYKHMGGYDLADGKELWKLHGGGDIPTPTPIVAGQLAYITNAHGADAPIYAIRLDARGDITLKDDQKDNSGIAWSYGRTGAYMQTPIVYQGRIYICKDSGILSCYDAVSGKKVFRKRLGTRGPGYTASAVAGDGKIYFTSEEGDVVTIRAGAEFDILSVNPIGEICMATPAISNGTLFFRTQNHLIAIAQ